MTNINEKIKDIISKNNQTDVYKKNIVKKIYNTLINYILFC